MQAVEWAHKNGLIKNPTKWSFCKLAVTNLVDLIGKKIMEERAARLRASREQGSAPPLPDSPEAEDVQEEPNSTTPLTAQ